MFLTVIRVSLLGIIFITSNALQLSPGCVGAVASKRSIASALGHRKNVITTDCTTQLAACQAELAGCYTGCWMPLYNGSPAPTGTDCSVYEDWFKNLVQYLPAGCDDYTASNGTPNTLSNLAYCHYEDVTLNGEPAKECPLTLDPCQAQQTACDNDAACTACYADQTAVNAPAAGATCEDMQAWYLATIDSFPATCDTKAKATEDLIFCRYDSTVFLAGITDCPAVPGFVVPTNAPTIAPTMSPSLSPTLAPTTIAGVLGVRCANITDLGLDDSDRGNYDVQCLGVRSDYCRNVQAGEAVYFSCVLSGSCDVQNSAEGVYTAALVKDTATWCSASYFGCLKGQFLTKLTLSYGDSLNGISSITCSDMTVVAVNAGSTGPNQVTASSGDGSSSSPGYCFKSSAYNGDYVSQLKLAECSGVIDGPYGSGVTTTALFSYCATKKIVGVYLSWIPGSPITYFAIACGSATSQPTVAPTPLPTATTIAPSLAPTLVLTLAPTPLPSAAPTPAPTAVPTPKPTVAPTPLRTSAPTIAPTLPVVPTEAPTTIEPSVAPTAVITPAPAVPTQEPTQLPEAPSLAPVQPTEAPTLATVPTQGPSAVSTLVPTTEPPVSTEPPSSTPPAVVTSAPSSSVVASRDLEITFTISDRTEATFTADDKSKLIAATAELAGVATSDVKIELSTDVTASAPVGRRLDTTQVLQVKEYITASTVATSAMSDPTVLSANSGMLIEGVTVTENPAQPPSKGSNMGLIIGIIIAGVAVFGIAMSTLFWRRRRTRNNQRAPPVEGRIAHDPAIEDGDKPSATHYGTAIKH